MFDAAQDDRIQPDASESDRAESGWRCRSGQQRTRGLEKPARSHSQPLRELSILLPQGTRSGNRHGITDLPRRG